MIATPPALIVTGLAHGAEFPAAVPPVEMSSCFQTILFVEGSNATRRLIARALETADVLRAMTLPTPLTTGCTSGAGGDSTPKLETFAQTISTPFFGSHAGFGHSTPPLNVGAIVVYWCSS